MSENNSNNWEVIIGKSDTDCCVMYNNILKVFVIKEYKSYGCGFERTIRIQSLDNLNKESELESLKDLISRNLSREEIKCQKK